MLLKRAYILLYNMTISNKLQFYFQGTDNVFCSKISLLKIGENHPKKSFYVMYKKAEFWQKMSAVVPYGDFIQDIKF